MCTTCIDPLEKAQNELLKMFNSFSEKADF